MFFLNIYWYHLSAIFIISLIPLYFYLTRTFNYWKSRGIDGPRPIVFFGTFYQILLKPNPLVVLDNAKRYGKIYGAFIGSRPVLCLADPEHIKDILIKDFHVFVDRNDFHSGDPFNDRSLFNLMGDQWRKMRAIISPTFSSGRMRSMHPIVTDCVKRLEDYLETKASDKSNNEIELKKVMSDLTMDVISSCAFGTKIDVYNDQKRSEFVVNAEKIFKPNPRMILFFLMVTTFPKLVKWLKFQMVSPSIYNFFHSAIQTIISRRKSDKAKHNDYLQLMINALNTSSDDTDEQDIDDSGHEKIFGVNNEKVDKSNRKESITEDDILSTSFLFFIAGYETTATLTSYLLYSLALDESCQRKLYEEIRRFKGDFNYESISKMHYLEACVAETLRLYNPVPQTGRMAAEEYTIGDTGLKIAKGMIVNLDIQTLHHSPEYYPNPDRWDPERFMPENRDQLVPYTYLPFGLGPRNCVGMRFSLMEVKTAVAHLVNKFIFVKTPATKPLTNDMMKKLHLIVNYGDLKVGIELRTPLK